VAWALSFTAGGAVAEDCARLAGTTFGYAAIASATNVAPPFGVAGNNPPTPVTVNVPFCRVQGTIRPTPDSDIVFEVWLPPREAWNGKCEGVGRRGFGGTLLYGPMDWALEGGYAVSNTDGGHTGAAVDASWAVGHPEKIVDFGCRAIHETALASKAIIEAYYAKPPAHAYFNGCSDAGREALMEAQRFPQDYDGIVAGDPANYWTRLLTNGLRVEQALVATPDSWISPEKLSVVTDAALRACHGESGVLQDPEACHFDPVSLACSEDKPNECLSPPQIAALKKIYSSMQDASGKSIYPGYSPGGESYPSGWRLWLSGAEPKRIEQSLMYGYVIGYFANMVFDNPHWNFRDQNLTDAIAQAEEKTGRALDAVDPDLSSFRDAGGKLIHYQGWNDAGVPAKSSIRYYKDVAAKMGGIETIQSFYRLFMAPGMQHCGLGLGPNAVGSVVGLLAPSRDPADDVVAALAHWVEDDAAQIIATLYRNNDPSKGIAAQRPWCPYPATARYSGQGERADAASYVCKAPAK
jgi:feruloyl esterase